MNKIQKLSSIWNSEEHCTITNFLYQYTFWTCWLLWIWINLSAFSVSFYNVRNWIISFASSSAHELSYLFCILKCPAIIVLFVWNAHELGYLLCPCYFRILSSFNHWPNCGAAVFLLDIKLAYLNCCITPVFQWLTVYFIRTVFKPMKII